MDDMKYKGWWIFSSNVGRYFWIGKKNKQDMEFLTNTGIIMKDNIYNEKFNVRNKFKFYSKDIAKKAIDIYIESLNFISKREMTI